MPRTVTITAETNELVGDETYEAWLKHAGSWTLVDAGDVDQVTSPQTFTFTGLVDGDPYSLQIRMKRAGRYRIGYLSADPDAWPADSRIDFVPGSLIGVGAPTLAVADWTRTDATHTKFALTITPNVLDQDIELYDNGTLIHTFAQPLTSPIAYDVVNPTGGINHAFKVRHVAGTLGGPFSPTTTKFAGPAPATGFVQTSDPTQYGKYDVAWDNDGRTYELKDDYLCNNTTFVVIDTSSAGTLEVEKETTFTPAGATQGIAFSAQLRAKVTSFGVDDYSAISQINIEMEIDDPDDGPQYYNSCP